MSYDLYFYKQKGTNLTETEIANYLTENLVPVNESKNQWFFENKDTEVYYSIETNAIEDAPETIELFDSFSDFDNTGFSFNLNFMRPSFFGLEAFLFVEKFIKDLGLFVLNPQEEFENPYIPTKEDLFDNWNRTNLYVSKDNFGEESFYYPLAESNTIWEFNYNRQKLQEEIGVNYFVSRVFFCKTFRDNKIVTLSTWTQHIPNILPKADYYLLSREYKKLFKTVKDTVLINRQTLLDKFGDYFEDYPYQECKIIHPDKAAKVESIFNGLKSEVKFEKFMERVGMEYLYNAKP
ncbi:MAG: hypothetical protein JST58_04475 [Bacteroidetes bacterium]|nr:hypothetical protein [Bacteroidota bacterium]